jgi:penicillin-binding protein 1A
VDLLDLVSAFQVFQQGGHRLEPYFIDSISDARGDLLWRQPTSPRRRVYDPLLNGEMIRMMQGVISHGTGARANFGRPAAGKTGTSQNWRDAWFVGFTPDWVAGVWLGDDAGRAMDRVAGGELPAETWRRFMVAAHKGLPVRDFENLPSIEGPGRLPPGEDGQPGPGDARPVRDEPPSADQPGDAPPPRRDESRSGFYDSLADDLGRAARSRDPN